MYKVLFLGYLLCIGLIVLQAEDPLCFHFSWIKEVRNKSITCSTTPIYDMYCDGPLIVTDNGKPPNTKKLWESYKNNPGEITCPMERGMVCVKSILSENKKGFQIKKW
ncbi:uncharacterized protein LOC119684544 [Teleopsis dalmanni]|uniref:uncharacterized protein LOC119684544 n=1 Tax=Teleopsis dalmanni TaxID=139649 RepID=UPI0018CEEEF9|nr:uncharacterized protein LOC119684544 [Teleopsis dalmanni]